MAVIRSQWDAFYPFISLHFFAYENILIKIISQILQLQTVSMDFYKQFSHFLIPPRSPVARAIYAPTPHGLNLQLSAQDQSGPFCPLR